MCRRKLVCLCLLVVSILAFDVVKVVREFMQEYGKQEVFRAVDFFYAQFLISCQPAISGSALEVVGGFETNFYRIAVIFVNSQSDEPAFGRGFCKSVVSARCRTP